MTPTCLSTSPMQANGQLRRPVGIALLGILEGALAMAPALGVHDALPVVRAGWQRVRQHGETTALLVQHSDWVGRHTFRFELRLDLLVGHLHSLSRHAWSPETRE